jgi:selenocysteine lyase/cysteine desulfurase
VGTRVDAGIRRKIPALSTCTYLDSAGAGLPPISVTRAMNDFVDEWSREGEHWEESLKETVELRRQFANLIGAKEREVGVVPSASAGLAEVASSLDFSRRKKVVVSDLNFPSNVILWQRMREAGILKEVEVLRSRDGVVPLEAWERAIDDRTAAVSVDYVSWISGYREVVREIARVAHKRGAMVIVDAFHGVGVFPIDVKRDGVDVLVCGFYKWLCGPHGAACVFFDERFLESTSPAYIGWLGVKDNVIERVRAGRDPFDLPFPLDGGEPSRTAARFEWGTSAEVVVRGAIEAVRFALSTSPESRFRVITKRKEELMSGLRELGKKMLTPPLEKSAGGGIVTFEAKRHGLLVGRLAAKKIVVSGRHGHLRVSPHFYNTAEEVDVLLRALSDG